MIRKLEAGRREDTNDGGARSAAEGGTVTTTRGQHGVSQQHAAHWAEIWVMLRCKQDVFRCTAQIFIIYCAMLLQRRTIVK